MSSLATDTPIPDGQFGLFFGQYRRRWMYGSFEIAGVAATALAASA